MESNSTNDSDTLPLSQKVKNSIDLVLSDTESAMRVYQAKMFIDFKVSECDPLTIDTLKLLSCYCCRNIPAMNL